jgi:hypothetical protein
MVLRSHGTPVSRLTSLRRALSRAAVVAAVLGLPAAASAAPKDKEAEKALTDAMELDYLETRFGDAEAKLRTALDRCGDSACSKGVKARLWAALGTVLAGGMNKLDDAKDAFIEALKTDITVRPDPALIQTAISYAFDKARAELAAAAPPAERLKHTPPSAHEVGRPLPIYVELTSEAAVEGVGVVLVYQAPGTREWISADMRKLKGQGYGGEVPCHQVGNEGVLRYFVRVSAPNGDVIAAAGAEDKPFEVVLEPKLAGEPARWPGYAPPEACKKTDAGFEALPAQCIDAKDCNEGLTCANGRCITPDAADAIEDALRKNWVGLSFVVDTSVVTGDDVCSVPGQNAGHFICLREDLTRYKGTPTPGNGNTINAGWGLSTLRVVLSYDRVLAQNFTIGGRAGFAFNGAGDGGASFLPLHLEARGGYWFGKSPFETKGARPFVFVSGGIAQIDTKVGVEVLEDGVACGAADPSNTESPCTRPSGGDRIEPRKQTLHAYKQAGLGFAGAGVGVAYAPVENLTLNLGVRGAVTFPVVAVAISPEAGLSFGF